MNKLHSLSENDIEALSAAAGDDLVMERDGFYVRLADTFHHRSQASLLIERLYSNRGYSTKKTIDPHTHDANILTMIASTHDQLIGTLSVGIDSPQGLLADELYCAEIDEYRKAGRSVGEFSKLAVDSELSSKEVLASLFHLAYIQLGPLLGITDSFIEVNPRHAPFYKRMLGFRQVGEVRICPRVNAPATLLHLDMSYAAAQILRFGGSKDPRVRSLYSYFFSPDEEAGLVARNREHPLADRRSKQVDFVKELLEMRGSPDRRQSVQVEKRVHLELVS